MNKQLSALTMQRKLAAKRLATLAGKNPPTNPEPVTQPPPQRLADPARPVRKIAVQPAH